MHAGDISPVNLAVKASGIDVLCELLPYVEEVEPGKERLDASAFKALAAVASSSLPEVCIHDLHGCIYIYIYMHLYIYTYIFIYYNICLHACV
jgi:hypothetical protein